MMSAIKKVGFALQWLWLPLLSYSFGLKLYALMISKGIDDLDWPLWRVFLVIALIFVVIMGKKLSSSRREISIYASLGAALPWGG